ncbi:MAG: rodlin [Nostoc sp.]|uniref:rodlin n=1 Tax=Nostoc sp. TaxID=1180 RepID=UPI002FEF3684
MKDLIKTVARLMVVISVLFFLASIPAYAQTTADAQKTREGSVSPQLGLVQGTLNKPCIGLPAKANVQSVLALVNVGVQDIPVLSSPKNQLCTENSTQAKGDEALSHILDNIPVLSGNGTLNH